MLKQPVSEYGYLFDTMLTFESAAKWCKFIADDLEWKDQEATSWHDLAARYTSFMNEGPSGVVANPYLDEKISLMSRPS